MRKKETVLGILIAFTCWSFTGCGDDDSSSGDAGTDTDADSDSDSDTDSDTDADADGGADAGNTYSTEILWAKRSGAQHTDQAYDVAALSDGSVVVTGYFDYESVFGDGEATETSIVTANDSEMYLARYASNGEFQWVRHAGRAFANGVATLPADDVAVIGAYFGTIILGEGEANETELISDVMYGNSFVAVYQPDGSLKWVRSIESGSTAFIYDLEVAAGPDGSVYVGGYFRGNVIFGAGEESEMELVSTGSSTNALLAKYSADGSFAWAVAISGEGDNFIREVASAPDGTLWVIGEFMGSTVLGAGEENETVLEAESAFDTDAFIAQYDADGALLQAIHLAGMEVYSASRIAITPDGSVIAAGTFSGSCTLGEGEENETVFVSNGEYDLFFAKFNTDGSLVWAIATGGEGEDSATGLAAAADGSAVLVGRFLGSMHFEDTGSAAIDLYSPSDSSVFAAKIDASGELVWMTQIDEDESTPGDSALGHFRTAIAPDASAYLSGSFVGTCTVGAGSPGEVSLTSELGENPPPGESDRLLVKIAP